MVATLSTREVDVIHISMRHEQSDTLKIHRKPLLMWHDMIHPYREFNMIWINVTRFNTIEYNASEMPSAGMTLIDSIGGLEMGECFEWGI